MELVAADRRVLKAFYTQYVAVLLIILTFTIGAFRRTITPDIETAPVKQRSSNSIVGEFAVADVFGADGALKPNQPKLAAISEVLKNHDLTIRGIYNVSRLEFDRDSASLGRALRRLASLRAYFREREVPDSAIELLVEATRDSEERVSFEFAEAERKL